MNWAILCSGGDAAGMNPAIKRFVDVIYALGKTPYLIYDGLDGLIDDTIIQAKHSDVAGIITKGGTIIRTSRSKRFFDPLYRKQAYENLYNRGITKLIVLGGDGSFRAMNVFCSEFSMGCVGIPSTIDNDIFGTEYCLGVDTALNVIAQAIDNIRDTASSFKRAFVVEVMGRECGYLAAISAMTSGAEICLIPEIHFDDNATYNRLTKEIHEGRNYVIAVVAEGSRKSDEMVAWLEDRLGLETRLCVLGHIQRGGRPSVYDRLMGYEFTSKAIEHLSHSPHSQAIATLENGQIVMKSIKECVENPYRLPSRLIGFLDDFKRE